VTMTYTPTTGPCANCRGSADGCAARKMFAQGEPCCRRCSHDDPTDNECSPPNKASMGRLFSTDKPRTTPGYRVQPPPSPEMKPRTEGVHE